MIIYKAENKINGKIYIGQTTLSLEKRIRQHLSKKRDAFPLAVKKYGLDKFTIEVIDIAGSPEMLSWKEKYWIRLYNSMTPNGYNLTAGGDKNYIVSQGTKEKIQQALIGHIVSQETREKIRMALKGNKRTKESISKQRETQTGRRISEETKKKMSIANIGNKNGRGNKGAIRTEETRKKLSISHKGKTLPESVRIKLSLAHKGNQNGLGYKHTEEAKRKIGQSKNALGHKGRNQYMNKEKGII